MDIGNAESMPLEVFRFPTQKLRSKNQQTISLIKLKVLFSRFLGVWFIIFNYLPWLWLRKLFFNSLRFNGFECARLLCWPNAACRGAVA
jgi:hypothetical protein